jgi:hypothetical protein
MGVGENPKLYDCDGFRFAIYEFVRLLIRIRRFIYLRDVVPRRGIWKLLAAVWSRAGVVAI